MLNFEGHFVWRTGFEAVSGAMTFGIGEAFAGVPSSFLLEAGRAGAHGVSGFISSGMSGGSPWRGFAAGVVGSASGSLLADVPVLNTRVGGTLAASATGGITTSILGGNFFEGAVSAGLVELLNQQLHKQNSYERAAEELLKNMKDKSSLTASEIKTLFSGLPQIDKIGWAINKIGRDGDAFTIDFTWAARALGKVENNRKFYITKVQTKGLKPITSIRVYSPIIL